MPAETDNTPAGKDLHAYINTGTYASPIWAEILRIENLAAPRGKNTGPLKTRGSPWEKIVPGQKTHAISFNYIRKRATDAVFDDLQDSYDNDTHLQVALTDLPASDPNAVGTKAYYVVTKFDEKQDLENAWQHDVELALAEHFESGTEVEPEAF